MRKCYALILFTALLCGAYSLKAQNFHLIKDINPLTSSDPSTLAMASYYSPHYQILNNIAYFIADDGIHGNELWRTDGTAAGTFLVKDITLGEEGTNMANIFVFKGKLFFDVIKPDHRQQLWVSDGTAVNTVMVKDSIGPAASTFVSKFTVSGDYFYFISGVDALSQKLWKSDGTTAGTGVVTELYTPELGYAYGADYLYAYNNKIYFPVNSNSGNELWVSDGTKAGTKILKDINPGSGSSYPSLITVAGGQLFFYANNGPTVVIYKSDGTEAGTHAVVSDNSISMAYANFDLRFAVIKDTLFFVAYKNNSPYYNMYRYNINDSAAGFSVVKQVHSGYQSFYGIIPITVNDSLLYFVAYDAEGRQQLWVTTGSAEACTLLKTTGNDRFVYINNLTDVGGQLYFNCYDNLLGDETYTSNGTQAGTRLLKDINAGIYSSWGRNFTYFGNSKVLFNTNDGVTGHELWITDGTDAGTALLKDINKTTTANGGLNTYYPYSYKVINNNQLLAEGVDEKYGSELWKTDGNPAGTMLIKDVYPGYSGGFQVFSNLQQVGKDYYYFPYSVNDTLPLWKTDGTSGNYVNTDNFAGYRNNEFYNIAAGTTKLYFAIYNSKLFRYELWVKKADGLTERLLTNINLSYNTGLTTVGDRLYFANDAGITGAGLWTSDGTAEGTHIVKDITPGYSGSGINNLTAFNGKLYFTVQAGNEDHLWVTDGTADFTYQVSNINVVFQRYNLINFFFISGSRFYFIGSDSAHGEELWASDGTGTGTKMVKDIMPGAANAGISNITDVNGTLYFTADDGIHGSELWKTNGTAATTELVKDITPGSEATPVTFLVNGNGLACFIVNNKLWVSNGTSEGTKPVEDNVLNGLTDIGYLVPAGNQLYLAGYNYKYGYESYAGAISSILPVQLLSFTGSLVKNDAALAWKTTNEINNNYFIVQRSLDGAAFSNLGKVDAANNQAAVNNYTFTDADVTALNANALYYRLQQVDKDGKSTLSNIVKLDIASFSGVTVSPNPAHKTAYIRSSININNALLMLTDMNGHVLYTAKQNIRAGAQVPVNIERLAAGTYNITLQAAGVAAKQFKLVIQ